jgi:glycosyltransferase involved in cell wall biosynthesis
MKRPLRVLVDGTSAQSGGGATFLIRQLGALAQVPEIQVTAFAPRSVVKALASRRLPLDLRLAPRGPLLARLLWEQIVLPWKARQFDVVYMTGNFALFASPRAQVVTFHNLYHFGNAARVARRLCKRRLALRIAVESFAARLSIRRATVPVALSWTMCRAIEEDVGPVSRLRVVYPGATTDQATSPSTVPTAEAYVLTVANDYPHKDWEGLITAFERRPDLPQLRIAGRPRTSRRRAELEKQIHARGLAERVQLLGALDEAEIDVLYANAACFVAHSFLEAFPQTPYEAMLHGKPVVASDIPSHREVCGDYAVFYPPERPDLLAAAVGYALANAGAPRELPPLARRTWSAHAEEFSRVLMAVVPDRPAEVIGAGE